MKDSLFEFYKIGGSTYFICKEGSNVFEGTIMITSKGRSREDSMPTLEHIEDVTLNGKEYSAEEGIELFETLIERQFDEVLKAKELECLK